MIILIDYDNVRYYFGDDLLSLVFRIISLLNSEEIIQQTHLRIKLYGGWYQDQRQSQDAQKLSGIILREFPKPIVIEAQSGTRKSILVDVEMAYGLEIDPRKHLLYTFRTRRFTSKLRASSPKLAQCALSTCPMEVLEKIINKNQCTQEGCSLRPRDILTKTEQKLVDTMLAADLIYLGKNGHNHIVVVSGDDDIWPAILTIILQDVKVTHLHRSIESKAKKSYQSAVERNYLPFRL